jgi:hypothetical protein
VCPHLQFAVPACTPWLQGDEDIREKVQERVVRMVSRLKGTLSRRSVLSWALKHLKREEQHRHGTGAQISYRER